MFTGIIENVATVKSISRSAGNLEFDIESGFEGIELGESIAVNGVCLTVTHFDAGGYARFFVSAESLAKSNLEDFEVGTKVNLERAVKAETRMSGHLVQGHVDGKGELISKTAADGATLLDVALDGALSRYCVPKGSITLNGISLTINTLDQTQSGAVIGITIIPHTLENTNLHAISAGAAINVEVDVIAKYVERLCQPYQPQ